MFSRGYDRRKGMVWLALSALCGGGGSWGGRNRVLWECTLGNITSVRKRGVRGLFSIILVLTQDQKGENPLYAGLL